MRIKSSRLGASMPRSLILLLYCFVQKVRIEVQQLSEELAWEKNQFGQSEQDVGHLKHAAIDASGKFS